MVNTLNATEPGCRFLKTSKAPGAGNGFGAVVPFIIHCKPELSWDEEVGFPASHSQAAAFPGSLRGRQGATETPTGLTRSFTYFSPPTNRHRQLAPALNVTSANSRRPGGGERTPLRPLTLRPLAGSANHGRRGPRAPGVGMDPTSLRAGPPTSGARPAVGLTLAVLVGLVGPRWGAFHRTGGGAGAKPSSAAPRGLRCQNFPLAPAPPQMSGLAHSSSVSPT